MTHGRDEALRVDVLLHRLCLTRSRNEAKSACDAGAVLVDGAVAKASQMVQPGVTIRISYPHSELELELRELPPKSTSRRAAREMYLVRREERTA